MIIVLKDNFTQNEYDDIIKFIKDRGAQAHTSAGIEKNIIGVIGNKRGLEISSVSALPGVEKVIRILEPYKLTSRKFHPKNSIVKVGNVEFGGTDPVIIAGPCSVESEEQIWEIASEVAASGGHVLRGGIFKPRSSPYSFQGVGKEGATWLNEAGKHNGLQIISEVMDGDDVDVLYDKVDIFQVGARNMQNFRLLKLLGKTDKPILLKRGISATLTEFLMSAEYILSEGNNNVILCERGIRTYVEFSRNTLDINVIPMIKNVSHLPIIVDPSHATGKTVLIIPVTMGALAAGADGFMVEIHPRPHEAVSDGHQSLNFNQFRELLGRWEMLKESIISLREITNETAEIESY
ncbi:3-deoxy-7-phosphoheptulonate synthase [Bacteroidota bacterium]